MSHSLILGMGTDREKKQQPEVNILGDCLLKKNAAFSTLKKKKKKHNSGKNRRPRYVKKILIQNKSFLNLISYLSRQGFCTAPAWSHGRHGCGAAGSSWHGCSSTSSPTLWFSWPAAPHAASSCRRWWTGWSEAGRDKQIILKGRPQMELCGSFKEGNLIHLQNNGKSVIAHFFSTNLLFTNSTLKC